MLKIIFIYIVTNIWSFYLNHQYAKALEKKQYSKSIEIHSYNLGIIGLLGSIVWGVSLCMTYDIYVGRLNYVFAWIITILNGIMGIIYLLRYKDLSNKKTIMNQNGEEK